MGYDLIGGIFFVLLVPMILLGFGAFWAMTSRSRAELEADWNAYAEARGLTFVPAEGEWPNRTNPAVTWTLDAASYRLAALGREARVRTCLTARPSSVLLGAVVLAADHGSIHVRSEPDGLAERIAGDPIRQALLAFHQGDRAVLSYRRGVVRLEWRGGERSPARLDEGRALVALVARAVDAAYHGTSATAA